jgi:hypothetical protein
VAKDMKTYEQFLARRNPFIQHAQEVVLQSGSRLIFAGAGRGSAKYETLRSIWKSEGVSTILADYTYFDEIQHQDSWAYTAMKWWLREPAQAIRDAVVRNLGIEPKDEVYLAVKRMVGPKQSTLLTCDFSQLERRAMAHYYGMSDDKFWKEYGQDLASVPGSVTGRLAGGSRSNFYDVFSLMDANSNGLRYGRLEGMRPVTGRVPTQNPPESKGLYPYQSKFRKLSPSD